jgi:hypothetical protein
MAIHLRDIYGVGLACLLAGCAAQSNRSSFFSTSEKVGRQGPHRSVTPVNQVITPAGVQVELPEMRPLVVALSPDGKTLLTSGKTSELVVIDPESREIRQRVALPSEEVSEPNPKRFPRTFFGRTQKGRSASLDGVSPDGKRVYLSNVNGSVKVFEVAADGRLAASFPFRCRPPMLQTARKKSRPGSPCRARGVNFTLRLISPTSWANSTP